jgi:CBS domain containing-hemolysin-like protein
MRLLSGKKEDAELDAESSAMLADHSDGQIFNPQERRMIERVLNLNQRTVSSIMTSRHDIEHIDLTAPEEQIRALLDKNQHTRVVVTGGEEEEELLGVVHVIDLLQQQLHGEPLNLRVWFASRWSSRRLPLLSALEQFRNARTHFAFVVDEFGSVEGLVTLSDVMETIAGNLPNEVDEIDARHDIQKNADGSWTANGHMPLEDLVQYVPLPLDEKREYHTIAGLLMEYLQRIPQPGKRFRWATICLKRCRLKTIACRRFS